jgi:hypothetical protein
MYHSKKKGRSSHAQDIYFGNFCGFYINISLALAGFHRREIPVKADQNGDYSRRRREH